MRDPDHPRPRQFPFIDLEGDSARFGPGSHDVAEVANQPAVRDYGRSVPIRAAVWDLGSSSFQVLVCDAGPCGTLEPVLRRRALLNLGFAVGAGGSIPPDRLAASVAAAGRLRRALDDVQPDVVVALATAAIRDASNGPEVVARLERVVGSPVRVLDGEEEAR